MKVKQSKGVSGLGERYSSKKLRELVTLTILIGKVIDTLSNKSTGSNKNLVSGAPLSFYLSIE